MEYSKDIIKSINKAAEKAGKARNEFVTPEHFLYALCDIPSFCTALSEIGADPKALQTEVDDYLQKMEKVPEGIKYELNTSNQFSQMFSYAEMQARNAAAEIIDLPHFVHAVLTLQDSFAGSALESYINGRLGDFTALLLSIDSNSNSDDLYFGEEEPIPFGEFLAPDPKEKFIGREEEISKIARILCRMENNNVLLVADHGVGKSALIRELCRRSLGESFPLRILGMRYFNVKPSLIMAGTEMRGALEKNIQLLMERIKMESDIIVVIEDFHTLFNTGSSNSSSDAASILSNYLTDNEVPFIATTTFQDIKKVQGKNATADRYFTRVDLDEMTRDDAVSIVKTLSSRYSKFHGIKYAKPALEYMVDLSIRHLPGCLPGKAISLMDDCGAWVEAHPDEIVKSIDKNLVEKITAEISGKKLSSAENDPLDGISERIKDHIFGQDKAVDALCTSLLISKAGLSNPQKPLGSFLFIGPTGVGKTQLARTLASELHENLVRFDMSEYA
ncbi:MAG: AAA family ATPase, partial [Bacteroidales bacterium]|nr:AAA family ATPase [Bacteroidales bacterium]